MHRPLCGDGYRYAPDVNMQRIIMSFAVIFIALGLGAFLLTGAKAFTALIPALFGVLLVVAGVISLNNRKLGGHIAALIGVVGFAGTARSLGKLPALISGEAVQRPVAVGVQAVFAVLCLVFVALAVKSFIEARKGA